MSANFAAFDDRTLQNIEKAHVWDCEEKMGQKITAAFSFRPAERRVSVEALDPLPTLADQRGRGRGGGNNRRRDPVLKVKRVPKSCKWRQGFNTQSDSDS